MELSSMFNRLWADYTGNNPSAKRIADLFTEKGEIVVNDHIAFRTLDDPAINIDVIAKPFIVNGFVPKGEYYFADKHLFARHFELPGDANAPRVFISQLIMKDFSEFLRQTLTNALKRVNQRIVRNEELLFAGNIFEPLSYEAYNRLRDESEYAAWFYVFGFRANHFTVCVNALKTYDTLEKVNILLKENGYLLNASGGEIKGSETDYLRQSSTMADVIKVRFVEGVYDIPCCYYEFAQRYYTPEGELFSGFVARSADKIFESTDFYEKSQVKR